MTLKELSQLYYLNREIEMDRARLDSIKAEIQKEERRLAELKGSATSPSSPSYSGMPVSHGFENKLEKNTERILELESNIKHKRSVMSDIAESVKVKQARCILERNKLEKYIADIPDSLLRLIFTYRFVDGLSWRRVSESIGVRTTEESVKKMCYRYLNENK